MPCSLSWLRLFVVAIVLLYSCVNAFSQPRHTSRPLPLLRQERARTGRTLLLSSVGGRQSSPTKLSKSQIRERDANKITTTTIGTSIAVPDYNENVGFLDQILSSYWGVRGLLMVVPAIYGTNFALGSSLNEALANPALTTALRMTLASLAISPWLLRIDVSKLLLPAILTGLCSAMGYIGQSIALDDVDPARVSFLGAAVVVWCPILEALFDGRPFTTQTWTAAGLCMLGVAILEGVVGGNGFTSAMSFASGDAWALLQAIGFGTQCYFCSKFITDDNKEQVIPFTAVLVTVTAITAWIWYGLTFSEASLPAYGLSFDAVPSSVWLSLAWTGLISTSANFSIEVAALGRVPSSEAAVFLSTEPIWAAIFAAALLGNTMTPIDYVGGCLMILACLVSSVSFDDILVGGAKAIPGKTSN